MNKIWLIIQREYLSRVKKTSFIVTTMLAPLSIIVLLAIQFLIIGAGQSKKIIVVKDESGFFVEANDSYQNVKLKDSNTLYFKGSDENLFELKESYKENGYDGVLFIPPVSLKNPSGIQYYSDKLLGIATRTTLEQNLGEVLKNKKIEEAGLDQQFIKDLRTSVSITERTPDEEGKENSSILASAFGFLMGFMMYLTIMIYGTMVMRGVMEEKTNRIVEVMLSSVKPFQLMVGKIVGIGMVGLTQFIIWIFTVGLLYAGIGFFLAGTMDASSMEQMMGEASQQVDMDEMQKRVTDIIGKVQSLPIGFMIFAFIFYFLGGYLFYSALFAAIGSAVGDDSSESQALVFPVTVPIIISFIILTVILEDPNSSIAFWSSIIPFSSPIIMPARIAYGLSPFSIDFFLSVLFLILGFMGTTWLAAKIYRTGILMMGKKVSLKEIGKWVVKR